MNKFFDLFLLFVFGVVTIVGIGWLSIIWYNKYHNDTVSIRNEDQAIKRCFELEIRVKDLENDLERHIIEDTYNE